MLLCLLMELHIQRKKGLYGFLFHFFSASPLSVGNYHFSELGSVVSQMIYSYSLIAQEIIYFINGISYHRASYMTDMERLCDIRGRILDNNPFAGSYIASAVFIGFFSYLSKS